MGEKLVLLILQCVCAGSRFVRVNKKNLHSDLDLDQAILDS